MLRVVLQNLYNVLFTPQFNVGNLCWGSVISENHSLHILQKKALQLITNNSYISHTEPLCKELRVLTIINILGLVSELEYNRIKMFAINQSINPTLKLLSIDHFVNS